MYGGDTRGGDMMARDALSTLSFTRMVNFGEARMMYTRFLISISLDITCSCIWKMQMKTVFCLSLASHVAGDCYCSKHGQARMWLIRKVALLAGGVALPPFCC